MQTKIGAALEKLEEALVSQMHVVLMGSANECQEANKEGGAEASDADVTKGKDAVAKGKEALSQTS
jgi:hypothetical protein